MKKVISVILASLMLLSCFGAVCLAADSYTKAYIVTAAEDFADKYEIVPYDSDSLYVKDGESFRFTIKELGSYKMNDTTVVRYVPADYQVQMLLDPEIEEGTPLYPEVITRTEKDEEGKLVETVIKIYTIPAVDCDTYIYVTNVADKSFSGILDFINGLFNFFVDFINWFFGLVRR